LSSQVNQIPSTARHVLILQNPIAGAGAKPARVSRLEQLLGDEGLEVEVIPRAAEIGDRAEELLKQGLLRAVVAAGGDGTAAEIANRTPPGTPLAVLPLGTENLLAKYIGQGTTPESACQTISAGLSVQLDAGRAGDRIFLLMFSAGFDAEVVRRVHEARNGNITHWDWIKPIWETIRTYEYPEVRLRVGEDAEQSRVLSARWAFVVNLPRYARGLTFTPSAVATDHLLDVCTFDRGSLISGLRYLASVMLGQHRRLGECTIVQGARVRVESDSEVPYQLDGDAGGFLPVDIEVVPGRLTLMVPRSFVLEHGFALPPLEQPR